MAHVRKEETRRRTVAKRIGEVTRAGPWTTRELFLCAVLFSSPPAPCRGCILQASFHSSPRAGPSVSYPVLFGSLEVHSPCLSEPQDSAVVSQGTSGAPGPADPVVLVSLFWDHPSSTK